jgi:sulfoxide reductase catalytic subunit YedY
MLIKTTPDLSAIGVTENDVTPHDVYLNRRAIMAAGIGFGLGAAGIADAKTTKGKLNYKLAPAIFNATDEKTPKESATSYNNFYEFGTSKQDPALYAESLNTRPWAVKIDGLCNAPQTVSIETLLKNNLQERIYRHRCVEAWSMVVPWTGFQLSTLLKLAQPKAEAKYVAFETLNRPSEMRGLRDPVLEWPYREGLRLDEAMHPLSFLAVGLYGELLPNQNGAPIRLVVPWKYGFKSIKSIVRITFTKTQPKTAWNAYAPNEYGFYSNVNPDVDHPRWSQGSERRLGEFLRRKTLPFNGYGQHVAGLYKGMDLKKFF